jgi:hypothetical protein
LEEEYVKNCAFDFNYTLESGKNIAKIYTTLENISINNKNSWFQIFHFFDENMTFFENFFLEYEDYIRDLSWNT